jgi:hypothetical protein
MRLSTSFLVASATLLAASTASALTTFNVTPSGPLSLLPDEQVTFDIRLSGGTGVFGLGASAWNYDDSVIDYVEGSGQSVASINNSICVPASGCFGGLANTLANPLVETEIGTSGSRVLIFNGVGLTATNSNPEDPGLDGVPGGNDAQIRITFRAVAPGTAFIDFGTGYNGDGEVLEGGVTDTSQNTRIAITVVPEPGTVLLMGLGLVGLAGAGRRK